MPGAFEAFALDLTACCRAGCDTCSWNREPRSSGRTASSGRLRPRHLYRAVRRKPIAGRKRRARFEDSEESFLSSPHRRRSHRSFRPGVMERLGLGYGSSARSDPRLIYVALTGYSSDASCIARGHDVNYLAMSGVLICSVPKMGRRYSRCADRRPGRRSMQAVIAILLLWRLVTGAARQRVGNFDDDGLNICCR